METKKQVTISLPNTIKIYDHYFRKKIILTYRPDIRLSELLRFQKFPHIHWIVYCRDTQQIVDIHQSFISQNITPGDCLDVLIKYSSNEIENINYSKTKMF
jgi:hypothetical protein